MGELNPNHPVTQQVHEHWHKIAAIMMQKLGQSAVEITEADVLALGDNDKAVVADCRGGRMVIRLISMEEARKIARQEGGLPV